MAKILVVDDEKDVREFLKLLLEDNGHIVKTAENSRDGIRHLSSFTPDLAILDIVMPSQSGILLYHNIRNMKEFQKLPVIILSAESRYRKQFDNRYPSLPPPQAYVEKPIEEDKFLELIASILPEKVS